MPVTVTSVAGNAPHIHIDFEGEISSKDIIEGIQKTIAAAAGKCYRILSDCRLLTGGHSKMVLDFVVSMMADTVPPDGFREAILMPAAESGMEDYARHFESAARRHGYTVRLFSDQDEALKWLLG